MHNAAVSSVLSETGRCPQDTQHDLPSFSEGVSASGVQGGILVQRIAPMDCGALVPSSPPHPPTLSPAYSGETCLALQVGCRPASHTAAGFTSGSVEAQRGSDVAQVTKLVSGKGSVTRNFGAGARALSVAGGFIGRPCC